MPLPQKVIEQLGREPPHTPGWSGKLLMFSGTIFFISLLTYIGLEFGYKKYLTTEVDKIQQEIKQFAQQIPVADQVTLARFYSQLGNINSLLNNQIIALRVFEWVEGNAQVNTQMQGLVANFNTAQLSFGAAATTLNDALQQIAWYEKRPEVQTVSLGGISTAGTDWRFSTQINLQRGYFLRSYRNTTTTSPR